MRLPESSLFFCPRKVALSKQLAKQVGSRKACNSGPRKCRPVLGYTWHMLWIKALHIVFVTSWFAGLFYLPRIFVNLADVLPESLAERARLLLMARKLYRFMTLLAVPAVALGLYLWLGYGIGRGTGQGWMHAKLLVVVLALGYHHGCGAILRKFEAQRMLRSALWFRWFNEIPVLLLLAAVALVVVKPF
jgi:protoporphyrinogen IX oxidase